MSSLTEKKREFLALLTDQGILPTIKAIKDFLLENGEKYKTLILIESHTKEVRKRQQQGIIDYERLHIEENRIRKQLIDLISDSEEQDTIVTLKTEAVISGTFTDHRDGQVYQTVKLRDGNIWMAQNFAFDIGKECCFYDNDPDNGKKYGRLYSWIGAQKACPQGWHLPSCTEWDILIDIYGGLEKSYLALIDGGKACFNAQLGGYSYGSNGFNGIGWAGWYWSSSSQINDIRSKYADGYHFSPYFGRTRINGESRYSEKGKSRYDGYFSSCVRDVREGYACRYVKN
jgi:uncharacterized protein (TIGR02145 family)